MRLRIEGYHLPGRRCGPYDQVHVGVQLRQEPTGLVPGDAADAVWELKLDEVDGPDGRDFRGPAVQGRRGERFVYLTWGSLPGARGTDGTGQGFEMFRRAKLMLSDLPEPATTGTVVARVDLTDEHGMPRCARLRPPALQWAVTR